jgi:hypothetical protein
MDPAFVDVVNRFGFQLQSLILDPDKSTGICATNIYHCLSMVAAGSKDENLAAFSHALGFDVDAPVFTTIYRDMYCLIYRVRNLIAIRGIVYRIYRDMGEPISYCEQYIGQYDDILINLRPQLVLFPLGPPQHSLLTLYPHRRHQ